MVRLPHDASREALERSAQLSDMVWHKALTLIAAEAEHTLKCNGQDCAGIIYPWVMNLASEDAQTFLACFLERFSDMTAEADTVGFDVIDRRIRDTFRRGAQ